MEVQEKKKSCKSEKTNGLIPNGPPLNQVDNWKEETHGT